MPRRPVAWLVCAVLLALSASACIEDELSKQSIVAQWRVLAIVADKPEARLEDTIRFEALALMPSGSPAEHGVDGVRFSWSVCVREEAVPGLSGLQYEPESPSQACGGSMFSFPIETAADGSATLSLPALLDVLRAAGIDISPERVTELAVALGIPPELALRIFEETGLPAVVELRMSQDGAPRVVAFKRFLLTTREPPLNSNPAPPRFRVCESVAACSVEERPDDAWITAVDGEPFRCEPESGVAPTVVAGAQVVLDPEDVSLTPGPDTWIEEYTVLDLRGELVRVSERAYYSWFSTAGAFDQQVTRAPAEEELWRAPSTPGEYPLWLVVRDGHGGTSACRTHVEVR